MAIIYEELGNHKNWWIDHGGHIPSENDIIKRVGSAATHEYKIMDIETTFLLCEPHHVISETIVYVKKYPLYSKLDKEDA